MFGDTWGTIKVLLLFEYLIFLCDVVEPILKEFNLIEPAIYTKPGRLDLLSKDRTLGLHWTQCPLEPLIVCPNFLHGTTPIAIFLN